MIFGAAACDPNESLVVYVNAMLDFGPLVTLTRASPSLHEIPRRIKLEYRRARRIFLSRFHGAWTVDDPDVILLFIDGDSGD